MGRKYFSKPKHHVNFNAMSFKSLWIELNEIEAIRNGKPASFGFGFDEFRDRVLKKFRAIDGVCWSTNITDSRLKDIKSQIMGFAYSGDTPTARYLAIAYYKPLSNAFIRQSAI